MTSLVWARPDALWLLLLVPLIAITGIWFGLRRGRFSKTALALRLLVVALLAIGLAEPMLRVGFGCRGRRLRRRSFGEHRRGSTGHRGPVAARYAGRGSGRSPGGARRLWIAAGAGRRATAGGESRRRQRDLAPRRSIDASFTDIASALGWRGRYRQRREAVVLLSDGGENVGQAIDQAAQAAQEGVPIDVVAIPGSAPRTCGSMACRRRRRAWEGEPITVLAGVESSHSGPGTVELLVDGDVWATQQTNLPEGLSSQAFTVDNLPPGFHELDVRVSGDAQADQRADDDQAPMASWCETGRASSWSCRTGQIRA